MNTKEIDERIARYKLAGVELPAGIEKIQQVMSKLYALQQQSAAPRVNTDDLDSLDPDAIADAVQQAATERAAIDQLPWLIQNVRSPLYEAAAAEFDDDTERVHQQLAPGFTEAAQTVKDAVATYGAEAFTTPPTVDPDLPTDDYAHAIAVADAYRKVAGACTELDKVAALYDTSEPYAYLELTDDADANTARRIGQTWRSTPRLEQRGTLASGMPLLIRHRDTSWVELFALDGVNVALQEDAGHDTREQADELIAAEQRQQEADAKARRARPAMIPMGW